MTSRPRTRLTREERRLLTREQVLGAALEVFEERGYANGSIEEIADRAGFTRKAVYSNFSGKPDLLLELVERRFQAHVERVKDRLGEGAPDRQAGDLAAAFSSYFRRERAWGQLFYEFCAVASRDERIGTRFRARFREARRTITELLEQEASRRGLEFSVPVERLAMGMFALFSGLSVEQLIDPDGTDADLFGEMMALLGGGALKGGPPGRPRPEHPADGSQ